MSDRFSKGEIETLRKGSMGAGLLVSVCDLEFFDMFKEVRSDETFADGKMRAGIR